MTSKPLPPVLRHLQRIQHLTAACACLLAACTAAAGTALGYWLHSEGFDQSLRSNQAVHPKNIVASPRQPSTTAASSGKPTAVDQTFSSAQETSQPIDASGWIEVFQYEQELLLWNALADWFAEHQAAIKRCMISPRPNPGKPFSGKLFLEARCEHQFGQAGAKPARTQTSHPQGEANLDAIPPERWQDVMRNLNVFSLRRYAHPDDGNRRSLETGNRDQSSPEAYNQPTTPTGWIETEPYGQPGAAADRQHYDAKQDRWQSKTPRP